MSFAGIIGAAVGGTLGTLIWVGVAAATGLEIGYVAWAVGGLVGAGSVALGGRGQRAAFSCAVIALIAILAGKTITVNIATREYLSGLSQAIHDGLSAQVDDFKNVKTEQQKRRYVFDSGWTVATKPEEVTEEETREFMATVGPVLNEMVEDPAADFESWREKPAAKAYLASLGAQVSPFAIVMESLGVIDVVFIVLGVGTAFRVANSPAPIPPGRSPPNEPNTPRQAEAGTRQRDKEEEAILS